HDGRIIFEGSYDELLHSELPPIRMFVDGAQTSRLSRIEGGDAPIEPGAKAKIDEQPAVELVGVCKKFGDKQVLRGVDLAIYPRRTTVLIGASGSGKSVIIKHVMGLFKPDAGKILVF